jgi:restriction system protein
LDKVKGKVGKDCIMTLPWDNNSWEVAAQIAVRHHRELAAQQHRAAVAALMYGQTTLPLRQAAEKAQLLLQAVIRAGERTDEGKLIEAVTLPWFDIIALLEKDPNAAFEIAPEKWEEIIAGAYKHAGFDEVTLAPRSGDRGKDVIAVKKALCTVRIIDQVKAFKPSHRVTANDVRALIGILQTDTASKAVLTTTSDFTPRISIDPTIIHFVPARLELVNGTMLMERLRKLARKSSENG